MKFVGCDSLVGIVTHYKLDCLGIQSRLARDFLQLSRPALLPIQYNGYLISFLGLSGQGVALSTHTHLVPEWMCVCVCVWWFDLNGTLWTQAMQYVAFRFPHFLLSSLPVNHTACRGTDSLQAGLSGNWILSCRRFSAAFQTCPRSHPIQWVHDFFSGISGQGVALSTHTQLGWNWRK